MNVWGAVVLFLFLCLTTVWNLITVEVRSRNRDLY